MRLHSARSRSSRCYSPSPRPASRLAQLVLSATSGLREPRPGAIFHDEYPMIALAKALDGLDDSELSPETRALFLGGNAARVYGIGA